MLPVAVEVHDEIRARRERGVHSRPEGGDETPLAPVPLHVVGPRGARDDRRAVGRAVVDDDHLDLPDVWDLAWTAATTAPTFSTSFSAGMTTASLKPAPMSGRLRT